jgi:DNA-directed RNA polymerase subunit RPC12/RpoP
MDKNIKVNKCWYCGGELCWNSDFNYDEVYGEGEGIVTFLTCMNCGAEVQYSLREEEE